MVELPDLDETAKICKNLHKFVRKFCSDRSRRCSPEIVWITVKSGGLVGLNPQGPFFCLVFHCKLG